VTGGAAWIGEQVELAGAAGRVEATYGIPGGFRGGHPNGVDIELERTRYDGRLLFQDVGRGIARIEAVGSYKSYYHEEIESTGICGVSFGLLTYDAIVKARVADGGFLGGAVLGVSAQHRDLATACLSFLPRAEEQSIGGFGFQAWEFENFDLEGAVRWDRREITPAAPDTNKAGIIRTRDFDGFSGSVAGRWHLDQSNRVRAIVSRTFQSPAIEELFSEGPHLAAYSYEVGNAALDAERSWGGELEYQIETGGVSLTAAAFYYDIDNYIFAADTGELEYGPGEAGYLSLYQYKGLDARLLGAETSCGVRLDETWSLQATASFVRGDLTGDDSGPLPRIPPLAGHADVTRQGDDMRFTVTARGAARQDRLGEFEEPTAGWFTLDASFEWQLFHGDRFHTIVARGGNLLDREYRNHLSRIKSIMPEAGRGGSLLYRISF
jgi:iron complex outermembrane recepter protein